MGPCRRVCLDRPANGEGFPVGPLRIMSADGGAYAGATFFSDKFTGSTLDRPSRAAAR